MKNEIAKFTLRLPPRLKRKLEKAAQRAGVSQSKYLCTLIDGKIPEPGPPASFWKLMQELYDLHDLLLYQKEPNTRLPLKVDKVYFS